MSVKVIYLTVQDLSKRMPVCERTIRNYAERASDEGKPVIWQEVEYWPHKLPGGGWKFSVKIII